MLRNHWVQWWLPTLLAVSHVGIDQCSGSSVVVRVTNGTTPGSRLSTVTESGLHVEFVVPRGHKDGTPLVVQYEEPSIYDLDHIKDRLKKKAFDDDAGLIQGHDGRDAEPSLLASLIDADHDGHPDEERTSTLLFRAPTAEPTVAPTHAPTPRFLSMHHRLEEVATWHEEIKEYVEAEKRHPKKKSSRAAPTEVLSEREPAFSANTPRWWNVDCSNIETVLRPRRAPSSAADQSNHVLTTEELWDPTNAVANEGGDHVGDTRFGGVVVTRQANLVLDGESVQELITKREPKAVLVSTHTFEDSYDVFAEVSTAEYLRGRYGVPTLHGVCVYRNPIDSTRHHATFVFEDLCHSGVGGQRWDEAFVMDPTTGSTRFAAAVASRSSTYSPSTAALNETHPSNAPFAAFRLATRLAHIFQEVSEISHGFIRDLGPHSLCVYRAHADPRKRPAKGQAAWEYLHTSGAAHEPWEEYHHQHSAGKRRGRQTKRGENEASSSVDERAQAHERQRLNNLMTQHNSHLPPRHPANFAFEVALRDPVRSVLFFDGPLANAVTARFLARGIPCRRGCGQDFSSSKAPTAAKVAGEAAMATEAVEKLYPVAPLHLIPGCSTGPGAKCAASPEAQGRCNKKTLRCLSGTSATHVYDMGKLPWLFPSLVRYIPKLADVIAQMTAQEMSIRPTFSRVRQLLGCLRKTSALSRHRKGLTGGNTKAYASCTKNARTFYLRDRDVRAKQRGNFAAPDVKYFEREITALKEALKLEPVPAKRKETLLKIAEYEQRAKEAAVSPVRRS